MPIAHAQDDHRLANERRCTLALERDAAVAQVPAARAHEAVVPERSVHSELSVRWAQRRAVGRKRDASDASGCPAASYRGVAGHQVRGAGSPQRLRCRAAVQLRAHAQAPAG
jgi:hypothetical protein